MRHLELIPRLCAADPTAGPIAALSQPERFHWLVAPSSTVVQPAEVHTGMTADPAATLAHLFATLVERPNPSEGAPGPPAADREPDRGAGRPQ